MNDLTLARSCMFLVGPDGCGKTETLKQTMMKVESSNNKAIALYLDFETYFKITRNNADLPVGFDHFVERYFDVACLEQLIKCVERIPEDHVSVSDFAKILTERLSVNYSFVNMLTCKEEYVKIIEHDGELKELFVELRNKGGSIMPLFTKLSQKLPYYDNGLKNSLRIIIDLLAHM